MSAPGSKGTRILGAAVLVLALVGCGDGGPSDPGGPPTLEALARSGDGQFALPGGSLSAAFEVLVRDREDGKPAEDVRVEWRIVEGSGGTLSRTTGFTDGAGRARSTLTLGSAPGPYRVRTRFPEARIGPVEFRARAVLRPEVERVGAGTVTPGSEVVLEGQHFVGEPEDVDVLFSGIRARVLSVDSRSLRVRVPGCLNEDRVPVVVGLGSVRSRAVSVAVEGSGSPEALPVGQVRQIVDPEALSCLLLEGGHDREYLAVVHSTSAEGAALHPYSLVLRTPGAAVASPGEEKEVSPPSPVPPPGEAQATWDARIRDLESAAVARDGRLEVPDPAAAPDRVPEIGDRRRFQVLNRRRELEEVEAEVRHVSRHAIVYVDLRAPDGGFRDGDLERLAREFDDPIHPTVTATYGEESDLDGNGRVVILFTPVVNRLSERGSDGFVGGFFYGVDLLSEEEGSNGGEIFYALVPDPEGTFGDARSRLEVLTNVPAVLAHEFQHMVHFNERILVRGAERTDALWLSEALATTAEELVAEVSAERGRAEKAGAYQSGNRVRARRYLADPSATSLVVNQGAGSLAERGAGWLFLAHLRSRGGNGILGELTRTTRTGVSNVTAVLGRSWAELVEPWAVALYLDGLEVPVADRYGFDDRDLREEVAPDEMPFPLRPTVRGRRDATVVADVRSSTAAYTVLAPDEGGSTAVNLAGPGGGALRKVSRLGLTVIRLR